MTSIIRVIKSINFKLLSKRFLAFIISCMILFVSVSLSYFNVPVKADVFSTLEGAIQSLIDFDGIVGTDQGVTQKAINDLMHGVLPATGVIIDPIKFGQYQLNKPIAQYLNRKYGNNYKTANNITDSDVTEYARDLNTNLTVNNNNSIQFNDTSRQMFIDVFNDYIASSISYGYFYDLQKSLPKWGSDVETYASFFSEYPDWYHECWKNGQGQLECVLINPSSNLYLVRKGNIYGQVQTDIYKGTVTNGISSISKYSAINENELMIFKYIDGNWSKQDITYPYDTTNWTILVSPVPDVGSSVALNSFGKYVTTKGEKLPLFASYNDLVTYISNVGVGKSIYYINKPVYNNWSQSTGDYVVTNDNSNNVTYGDVNTYIDDHHTETGDYPSVPDINVWIESQNPVVTPTPVPTGSPSQGGSFVNNNNPSITNNPTFNNNPNINITLFPSVSDNGLNGGTVSGNGGQGSIGNIFDWLGNLGNVIASLIKNVGEMIVNALQGVVEAVTTILSAIPNILTPMIEFVFGGLPDEIKALITLGITCIIFVGIIKALKR